MPLYLYDSLCPLLTFRFSGTPFVLADDTRMLLQQPRFGRCFQAGRGRWSVRTGEVFLPVPRCAAQRFCFIGPGTQLLAKLVFN